MSEPSAALGAPRFETTGRRLIAGFRESYAFSDDRFKQGIGAQWQRLGPMIGRIPGQVGAIAYGVCFGMFGNAARFDYIAGVEVAATDGLPDGFTTVLLPPRTWAVFPHRLHATRFNETMAAILRDWLPGSGQEIADGEDAPDLLESYGDAFDPATGLGGMELWLPVRSRS
ncbi:MAG: GyrI-like domain-containing protein [Pseudomonadota bacterium]